MADALFGDVLGGMLDDRNRSRGKGERRWSAARLGEAVAVDAAEVRRWLRNEDVPSLKSPHMQNLAATLRAADAERDALLAAQVYSLRHSDKLTKKRRRGAARTAAPRPGHRERPGTPTAEQASHGARRADVTITEPPDGAHIPTGAWAPVRGEARRREPGCQIWLVIVGEQGLLWPQQRAVFIDDRTWEAWVRFGA